jgi:hypothetical protein
MTTTQHLTHPHGNDPLGPVTWTAPRTLPTGTVVTDLFGPLACGAYGKVASIFHKPRRPGERESFTVWNMQLPTKDLRPHFAGNETKAREIAESFLPVL